MKAKNIQYIAHRGAMNKRAENALTSFVAALKEGHTAIELDIRTTKDNQVVVFHDASLARLTDQNTIIKDVAWKELKESTVNGEPITRLSHLLRELPPTTIYIEIKDPLDAAAGFACAQESKTDHTIIFISKSLVALRTIASLDTNNLFQRGLVANKRPLLPVRQLQQVNASYFICHQWIVNWFMMKSAKRRGISVIAYPVSSKLQAKILQSHGVAGLMIDVDPGDL